MEPEGSLPHSQAVPVVLLLNFACNLHIYNIWLHGHSGLLVPLWLWIKEICYDADIVSENFPRWVIPFVTDGLGGSNIDMTERSFEECSRNLAWRQKTRRSKLSVIVALVRR